MVIPPVFFRAIAVSLVVNLTALIGLFVFPDGYSGSIPVDERVYLKLAIERGIFKADTRDHNEVGIISHDVDHVPAPNFITDIIVGSLANFFGASPQALGTILDLLCCLAAYLLVTQILRNLSGDSKWCEFGALFFVVAPFLFVLNSTESLRNLIGFPPAEYEVGGLPMLRGIYTQLSIVIFLCAWYAFSEFAVRRSTSIITLVVAGILCGLTAYVYTFVWIAGASLIGIWIIATHLTCRRFTPKSIGAELAAFSIPFCLVSLPAISIARAASQELVSIERNWYWSWTIAIEFSVLAILQWRYRANRKLAGLFAVLVSCPALELLLLNLQPVLGVAIQPFHFSRFVLHPVFSCVATVVVGMAFEATFPSLAWFRLRILFGTALAIATVALHALPVRALFQQDDTAELLTYLKTTSPDSVLAVMTDVAPFRPELGEGFSNRSFPNLIYSLSGRSLLHQSWYTPRERGTDGVQRELLLGWLFSGRVQMVLPCPTSIAQPGDLIFGTWTAYLLNRKRFCEALERERSVCQLLKTYRVDYVLRERFGDRTLPDPASKRYFESVWKSSGTGNLELLAFDRAAAIEDSCR